jgi:hypothetical protein
MGDVPRRYENLRAVDGSSARSHRSSILIIVRLRIFLISAVLIASACAGAGSPPENSPRAEENGEQTVGGFAFHARAGVEDSVPPRVMLRVYARNPAAEVRVLQLRGRDTGCWPRLRLYRAGERAPAWDSDRRPNPGKDGYRWVCASIAGNAPIQPGATRFVDVGGYRVHEVLSDSVPPGRYRATVSILAPETPGGPERMLELEAGDVLIARR